MTIDESIEKEQQTAIFGDYGEDFQKKVMQALMVDPKWSEQIYEIIKPSYFDLQYLQYISEKFLSYYREYKLFPSQRLLITILKKSLEDESDKKLIKKVSLFFKDIKTNPELSDLPFIQKQALKFCKNQAYIEAVDQCVDLIKKQQFDKTVDVMKKASTVGQEISSGHNLKKDREKRWSEEFRKTIPTGVPELDSYSVFDGGLGRGELGVIMAPKGVGKSHWLVQVGANALLQGYNVIHYSLEMAAEKIACRYDAWLTEINSKEICKRKDEVREIYENSLDSKIGELTVKKYPMGQVSTTTLRAHFQQTIMKENIIPDLVIVDYADIMRATEKYDTSQTRFELKKINQDLKNLAEEFNVPVWTAFQANKEGSKNSDSIITIADCAEGYGRADEPDIIIGFGMPLDKKDLGYGIFHIAKSRDNGDGMKFNVFTDRRFSKFKVVSEDEVPDSSEDEEKRAKDRIRSARKKLKNDKEMKKLDDLNGDPVEVIH